MASRRNPDDDPGDEQAISPDDYPDAIWTCSCGAFVVGREWRKHAAEKHPDVDLARIPTPRLTN